MGQAKQRKRIMGDRYGKESNPWCKKSDRKSVSDFLHDIDRTYRELLARDIDDIFQASEDVESLDFSGFKVPLHESIANMFPLDAINTIEDFSHGKSLGPTVIKNLSQAPSAKDYMAMVPSIPKEIAFAVVRTTFEKELSSELPTNHIHDWPLELKAAFHYFPGFASGVYFYSLEHSQEIEDLILLRACKLLAISACCAGNEDYLESVR